MGYPQNSPILEISSDIEMSIHKLVGNTIFPKSQCVLQSVYEQEGQRLIGEVV